MKEKFHNRFSFPFPMVCALCFVAGCILLFGMVACHVGEEVPESPAGPLSGASVYRFILDGEDGGESPSPALGEKEESVTAPVSLVFWAGTFIIAGLGCLLLVYRHRIREKKQLQEGFLLLNEGMKAVQRGDYTIRIGKGPLQEAETVFTAFDEMAETLERSDRGRRTLVDTQLQNTTRWIREMRRRQKELASHGNLLEEKVAARTRVLESINTALRSSVRSLERRTLEITLLNRLAESLQHAKHAEDAATLVIRACQQIFPSDAGVFAFADADGKMQVVAGWGRDRPDIDSCMGDACPRKQKGGDKIDGCSAGVDGYDELCIPVIPREGGGAMMRIRLRQMADLYGRRQAARRALAGSVAGHLAACLTSLHLVDRLRREAVTDPLTGLYNRRYMEETFLREFARVRRENIPLSVILMDVDHFKIFNDTHGHDIGDAVLRHLAVILKKDVRTEDVACRFGGEEFLLLMPGLSSDSGLERGEFLRRRVEESPLVLDGYGELSVTLSMGLASYPEDGELPQDLILAADKAMYEAKAQGRNRIRRPWRPEADHQWAMFNKKPYL
ncbi:GGDEF domain-containing protein [Desulfobotulus sp. H1]|uniref:diguanylate cyclase n=1 Tax=Desulfobotulus pelophilus TaxID=2823377 RepID=A0ABT3N5Q8_9BACT|nr:GGDEF domain-containing protein [Desulfobotulus pelophilus]MCW7752797.1 GGDEF domain-containing protein [Desulfobotulus pelophilus]